MSTEGGEEMIGGIRRKGLWFILKIIVFGTCWGHGYKVGGVSDTYCMKYRGKWYAVSIAGGERL